MNAIIEKTKRIAILGNPNTGKSTLFNSLSKTQQRIANYPGVTIDQKLGEIQLDKLKVELIDLPGSYSLRAISPDEQVAVDVLMGRLGEPPELVIFILDAINLQRNLFLFTQLCETQIPVVVALTMTDQLEREGIALDQQKLSKQLGVPVVDFYARSSASVQNFKNELKKYLLNPPAPPQAPIKYPLNLDRVITDLQEQTSSFLTLTKFEGSQLLFFDDEPLFELHDDQLSQVVARQREKLNGTTYEQLNNLRFAWAAKVTDAVEKRSARKKSWVQILDSILTHKVFGLLIFTAIMYLVFSAIYSWATPMIDGIEWVFGWLGEQATIDSMPALTSLISDGIIGGVGSVVVFLPQIIILFIFIALLEASGYLARASFLMDKLFSWSGLNGRSFIPMLSSFACAIPGVMAARVMPDARARLTTILISPLMSCSARLPVYLLLISAFIEPQFGVGVAAFTLFAMHALGLFIALPMAWVLNKGFLKTPPLPFVLEMPPYRLPHWRNVFYRVLEASKKFMVRAGTIIFAMSLVIWFLSYFPRPAEVAQQIQKANPELSAEQLENKTSAAYLEQSYLGRAGKFVQPIFAPLGYDWKISVGILGAFPAREVIIATLGIVYNVGADVDEESAQLKDIMKKEKRADGSPVYTPLLAFSLMIFFALCAQCMSTIATVQRELKSTKWAVFLFFYMTALAYLFALGFYQAGLALGYT